jgi:thiol-disulfide isomerase/thioredoxin
MKTTLLFILLALASRASDPGTTLQAPDGTKISWDDLVHRYAGKVIYLDIWASWCGPCRHEAPYFDALRTEFGKDSVVFLSVSIDADPQDWQGALNDLKQTGNPGNFLLLDGHHSSLNNNLHIKGVPRYALLDGKGNFVDKDAPFPSSGQVEGRIRTLLRTP